MSCIVCIEEVWYYCYVEFWCFLGVRFNKFYFVRVLMDILVFIGIYVDFLVIVSVLKLFFFE